MEGRSMLGRAARTTNTAVIDGRITITLKVLPAGRAGPRVMRLDIRPDRAFSLTCRYSIAIDGACFARAVAHRAIWPFFRKASLRDEAGTEIATMRQRGVWQKVLETVIPGYGCPFVICVGGSELGWIWKATDLRRPVARGVVNGVDHAIYGCPGGGYRVYRLQEQVGSIWREATTNSHADAYQGQFAGDLDPAVCACLILFVDLAWHRRTPITELSGRPQSVGRRKFSM
jgi:hypothetical protein